MIKLCGIVYTCFIVRLICCCSASEVGVHDDLLLILISFYHAHSVALSLTHCDLGVGFVGRHLTAFLISQKLASKVRVVDKVPPATGWLNAEHSVSQTTLYVLV